MCACDLQQSDVPKSRGLQPSGGRLCRLPNLRIEAASADRRYAYQLLELPADVAERRLYRRPDIRRA
jgi:hypothetical protein